MILPQQCVDDFRKKGYYVTEALLPSELLAGAREESLRYQNGERDFALPLEGGFLDWRPEHGNGIRINDYVSLQSQTFADFIRFPLFGEIAGALLGSPVVRLFHDQLISKPPAIESSATAIGWHVDASYWRTCSTRDLVTAWVPLTDCQLEMGPIMYVPGSHLADGLEDLATFLNTDLESIESRLRNANVWKEPIKAPFRRGQVAFHHACTVHGSAANRSGRIRTSLTIHMQAGHNRYQRAYRQDGSLVTHLNDLLCRKAASGDPDYTDPEICPILWQSGA